jgi:hypothetical protein
MEIAKNKLRDDDDDDDDYVTVVSISRPRIRILYIGGVRIVHQENVCSDENVLTNTNRYNTPLSLGIAFTARI